jgi:hypothetical protein
MSSERIDLGHGHDLRFLAWQPDRDLNPQYAHLPDVERYGAIVSHELRPDDQLAECQERGRCEGAVTFNGPVQAELEHGRDCWDVQSWEPLTCSPSLLCHCGDHGFIQQGRWVPA